MLAIRRPTVYPIGLDVGHDCVKMVQLQRAGEHLSVLGAAKAPLPAEARAPAARARAAAEGVRRILKSGTGGFRGRRAVAAVPREHLHVRNLRLSGDLTAPLPQDIQGSLGFEPAEAALELIAAGEVRQGGEARQEVILLAARHAGIQEFLLSFQSSGLRLESLDAEPCALYRTVDRFVSPDQAEIIHALVDVGSQRTQVVVGRGHDLQFMKAIEIGGCQLADAVTRKLGITPDEAQALRRRLAGEHGPVDPNDPVRHAANDATRAVMEELAGEISMCLRYHAVTFRGQRPGCVTISGGASSDPQLRAVLGRVLALRVSPATAPVGGLDARRLGLGGQDGALAEWAVALGLALKCVDDVPTPLTDATAGRVLEVAGA